MHLKIKELDFQMTKGGVFIGILLLTAFILLLPGGPEALLTVAKLFT